MEERHHRQLAHPPEERVGMLRALYENTVLTWKLLWDGRVGFLPKVIPLLAVIYALSPIDLLPAWLMGMLAPLGVADDIGIILLALSLFVQACPPDVVAEHLREMRREHPFAHNEDVVEGEAREIEE